MATIGEFFAEKSVLVTGATGFVGKVLIEKLLRSCGSVENIFLLIRTKKNENAQQRYKKYVEHPVFDRIRREDSKKLNKLQVVSGDVSENDLGLSETNKLELLNKVQVIFHCAAAVRFDFTLLEIMKTNVIGTQRVLQLAEKMEQLKAFVYVSTAFSQSYQTDFEEKYYPTGYNIFHLLANVKSDNKTAVKNIERELFKKGHPSTYTMSKAFAEELVYAYKDMVPVVVIRPSIVVSAHKEPVAGYVDGLQSTTGLHAAQSTGIFRCFLGHRDTFADMVPVDFAANAIISTAWRKSIEHDGSCRFYNCSSSFDNRVTWHELNQHYFKIYHRVVPYKKLFWHPGTTIISSYFVYLPMFLLTQLLPALLIDLCFILCGKKTFMTKIQKKIFLAVNDFRHFTRRNFNIRIANYEQLFDGLNDSDKVEFIFSKQKIDWLAHSEQQMKGIRKFVFLEDDSTIPMAQKKLKRLYCLDAFVKLSGIIYLLYFLVNRMH